MVDDEPKVDSVAVLLPDVIAIFVVGMVVVADSFALVVVVIRNDAAIVVTL